VRLVADAEEKEMSQAFRIHATWAEDKLTPEDVGTGLLETFRCLEPLAPVMRNWCVLGAEPPRGVPLDEARQNMTALVEESVTRNDFGEPEPESGYRVGAYGWEVPETWDARTVHITVGAGSTWLNADIEFEIGDSFFHEADASLVTYPVFKGALEAFAAVWPLPWALAYASVEDDEPPIDAVGRRRPSPFEIAWIAYLSAPLVKGVEIPDGLVAESTPGGGVLLSAVEVTIDQMNPDHMRRSRALEKLLIERIGVGDEHPEHHPASHPPRTGPY
jgi:hypothetical protein